MMKKNFIKIIVALLFVFLFALLNWNSFSAPFERDEGEYAYSAWLLRTGDTPYKDSFLQKPPLIIYTYLFGQIISPFAVWPPRVIAAIFVFLTAILVGLIAYKEWGKIAGIFSAFLFLPFVGFPPLTPFSANTEKFMILPMVALLALFVYFKDSKKKWPYILAGVLATLAVFYKPICVPVVLFIIIFWLFKIYHSTTPNKLSLIGRPVLLVGISAIVTGFVLLIPFLKVLPDFIQEVFVFNMSYVNAFDNPFGNFSNYLSKFFHYWWVLIPLPFILFFKRPKNIFYYFILFIISLITVFTTPIGHYYIIVLPFFAIICGALFSSFLDLFEQKQKIIITIIVLPITLYILIFPFKTQFSLNPQELSTWVYGTVNPFGESEIVSDKLAQITNPDDLVFVAGSEPQIYYYAKRKSGTRFVITYPLNLPTPYREKFQTELINDLEKNMPEAIVVSERVHSGLWNEGSPKIFIEYFDNLISENYEIVGGYVWDNSGGHWQEPMGEESIPNASLILLSKKK